jgi:hypothetical protein
LTNPTTFSAINIGCWLNLQGNAQPWGKNSLSFAVKYQAGAASGARASMKRTEVCVASSVIKNGLSSEKKPTFGNRVEPSAQTI